MTSSKPHRWRQPSLAVTLAVSALVGWSANAQSIVDDTASALSEAERKALFSALLTTAKDPLSGQFARLDKPRPEVVCGLVNLRTMMGGYAGFQPFAYHSGTQAGRLTIAPSSGETPRRTIEVLNQIKSDCSREATPSPVEVTKPLTSSPVKVSGLSADRVNYGCVEMTGEMLSQQAPRGSADRIISACKAALLGAPSRAADLTRCGRKPRSLSEDEAFMFKHICRAASDLLRKR